MSWRSAGPPQPTDRESMKLREFLEQSQASAEFRDAIQSFLRDGRPNERLRFDLYSPPVKVERTLTKLLEQHPDLPIEQVEIEGSSGCEFYRGQLRVTTESDAHRIRFHWDCKWRAMQEGWTDYFGFPDQTRAAREFGYDCFRVWEPEG